MAARKAPGKAAQKVGKRVGKTARKRVAANNKTVPQAADVLAYIERIDHAGRREDALTLLAMMQEVTAEPAVLWGPSIIGFGQYHYVYDSGREGDAMLTGFAPRKANMVVYIMPGFSEIAPLLKQLGPHKVGKSCLYLGRLSKVDLDVLRKIVTKSVSHMRKKYNV